MRQLFKIILIIAVLAICPQPSLHAQTEGSINDAMATARRAGVREEDVSRILALGVKHNLSTREVYTYLDVLKTAAEEKLPCIVFADKIEEGLTKKVQSSIINTALNKKLDDYRYANLLLTEYILPKAKADSFTSEQLSVVAEGLSMGVTRRTLLDFVENAPSAPLEMFIIAIENLAPFYQIGFDENQLNRILYTGLRQKALTPSWQFLFKAVNQARKKGIEDSEFASVALSVINKKGMLRDVTMQLGFTGRDLKHGPEAVD